MAEEKKGDAGSGEAAPQAVMQSPPKVKHDWYQTETHVVITILAKNVKQDDVKIDFTDRHLHVQAILPTGADFELNLNLPHTIVPAQCSYKVLASKIEVKLKKCEGIRWNALEAAADKEEVAQPMAAVMPDSGPPKYPSSAPKAKDWDRVVGAISKEEEEEKPEGEAALNALFQKIYSQGSDEVKRAMNKSFQESGGTVLSTNWSEVAKDKVEVKAPDGMEWRKWDS